MLRAEARRRPTRPAPRADLDALASQNALANHIREIIGTGIEAPYAAARAVRDRLARLTRAADLLGYRSKVALPQGPRRAVGGVRRSTGPGMEKAQ